MEFIQRGVVWKKSIFWILTKCITELQLKILFTKYISGENTPDKKISIA
jgi:hypothetical protein